MTKLSSNSGEPVKRPMSHEDLFSELKSSIMALLGDSLITIRLYGSRARGE